MLLRIATACLAVLCALTETPLLGDLPERHVTRLRYSDHPLS